MTKRTLTRREFIRLSAVGAAGVVVTACTPATATQEAAVATATAVPPTKPVVNINATATLGPTSTPVVKFQEAPMLAELVKAGKLPEVTDRLPENPCVMVPLEKTGSFGGTIRRAFKGVSDRNGPGKLQDRTWAWFDESLAIQPRMMESWEVNADGTEWTFYMRKGTKWSDGTPHTTADIVWYFDNVLANPTLTKAPPSQWSAGKPRELAKVTAVDDYTVKFTFVAPKPMFIYYVTRGQPAQPGFYLKKYHADLTDDKAALDKEVTEKGAASWDAYYNNTVTIWQLNPELPTLGAWLGNKAALSTDLYEMNRNPYFFAVDPEGNQLPYIDKITHRLFETADVLNLWVVGGEIDFQYRHMSFGNFTLYKENEAKGDYKTVLGINASHLAIQPNHTCKDPNVRELFQNRDVRIAMSLAMNRQEINDLVWDGMLTPRQYSPLSLSPQYYEKASTAYIDYDPDKANQLLDAAGYDKKDAKGMRLYKDGTPISITIEGTDATGTPEDDTIQLAVKYLKEVGIDCAYKSLERSLYTEHYNANELQAAFWGGDRTVLPLVPEAIIFRGVQPDRPWAPAYALFYLNGANDPNGEEPPADSFVKKIWDIWDEITVTVEPEEQNKKFFQILDIWAEEVPMIGLLGEMPAVCIVKNGMLNFKEGFPADDTTGDENVYNTETLTWDDPTKHTA
jgi:peptide/nickel transport system substrate-binding protein